MPRFSPRAVFLAACLINPPLLESFQQMWLDVPFVRQVKNGCGTACIAMVLKYWDQERSSLAERHDSTEILDPIPWPPGSEVLSGEMESYFKRRGFRTFAFSGEWADLILHISKGRPLIACLRTGRSTFHYVVVAGINPDEDILLINDPAQRKLLKWRRADFEKGWKGTGNWTLLALP